MITSIFMIRHKPTGNYLPARKERRGYSNDEPVPDGGKFGPRIFPRRINAERVLTAWLAGIHQVEVHHDWELGPKYDEDRIVIIPQPHRKRSEMEIVEFLLTEVYWAKSK